MIQNKITKESMKIVTLKDVLNIHLKADKKNV